MSQHTNNPFGAQTVPGALQATANRFPDVSQDPHMAQYNQQAAQQQMQQQQYQQQQQQQQQSQFLQPQYTSFQAPSPQQSFGGYPQGGASGFQPQTMTGQQIQSQVTGIQQAQQYGGGSPYQQGGGGSGSYGGGGMGGQGYGAQQQSYGQPQQAFVNDLDPYGNLGVLQNSGQGQGQRQQAAASHATQQPEAHPRTFVQSHKDLLTQWDEYSWKQLLNRVDGLREAWEARKRAVMDVSGQGGDPSMIEGLRRQAESNIDSIHASKLQISEVKEGWRHSTDVSSKARVRESLNSGLNSLPDFPTALAPENLGGIYAQRATEDYRKQSILSNFNTPQQQGFAPLYAQPTGYPGMAPQQTGYPQQGGMVPQQTGYPQQQGSYMGQQQTGFYGRGGGYQQGGQYYG
ncbi:hypothetical protein P7C70_g2485, partial [Phenoliferia sp. Uapishka_3]